MEKEQKLKDLKTFLTQLGIEEAQIVENNRNLVVDFQSDKEWDNVRSKLDACHSVIFNDDASASPIEATVLQYTATKFNATISLMADFINDDYKLVAVQN